jgi:hypothetical protein
MKIQLRTIALGLTDRYQIVVEEWKEIQLDRGTSLILHKKAGAPQWRRRP